MACMGWLIAPVLLESGRKPRARAEAMARICIAIASLRRVIVRCEVPQLARVQRRASWSSTVWNCSYSA